MRENTNVHSESRNTDGVYCSFCGMQMKQVTKNHSNNSNLKVLSIVLSVLLVTFIVGMSIYLSLINNKYKSYINEYVDLVSQNEQAILAAKETISDQQEIISQQKETIEQQKETIAIQQDNINDLQEDVQEWKEKYLGENSSSEMIFDSLDVFFDSVKVSPSNYIGKRISISGCYFYDKDDSRNYFLTSVDSEYMFGYYNRKGIMCSVQIHIDEISKALYQNFDQIIVTGTLNIEGGKMVLKDCEISINN